jgi:hypothetical protein
MSRRVSNHNKYNSTEIKRFCKVCKDSGKPKADYESHNPKNEKGIVCCPIIKAHHCKKCFTTGHFESYCTVKNIVNNKINNRVEKLHEEEKKKEIEKKSQKGGFSLLWCDDDDYLEEEIVPAKPRVVKSLLAKSRMNWADCTDSDSDDEISPNVTLRPHQKNW